MFPPATRNHDPALTNRFHTIVHSHWSGDRHGRSYLVRQSPRLFTRTVMKEAPFLPAITKLEDVGREKPFCQCISKACLETHTPREVEWRQRLFCFCHSPQLWIQSHMRIEYHWHCSNICQEVPHNPDFTYFYLSQCELGFYSLAVKRIF